MTVGVSSSERIARLREALSRFRGGEELREAILEEGFLGVTGEGGVGKTTMVRWAEAMLALEQQTAVIRVDFAGAYSMAKLVARWRHALLRAVAGPIAASHAAGLPRSFWPASTERAMLEARAVLGAQFDNALQPVPAKGERIQSIRDPLEMTASLARSGRSCVLLLDHIEAPLLTSRHPLSPRDLLWQIRAEAQRIETLHVAVVCAAGAEHLAAAEDAAFYGDGRWITVSPPSHREWELAAARAGMNLADEAVRLGRGHVETTLQLARLMDEQGLIARDAFLSLAAGQGEHATRCLAHADSLHRLGAQVLLSIANNDGPYAGTPDARSDDVAAAVSQLRLAGLIRRDPSDERGWLLVDPLVRWRLAEAPELHEDDPMPEVRSTSTVVVDVLNAINTLELRRERPSVANIAAELTSGTSEVEAVLKRAEKAGFAQRRGASAQFALTEEGNRLLMEYLQSR